MSGNGIFALDIGTRSVVGVVMQETPKGLEIIASEHLEHQNRAMIDGQIHDIEQVAAAVKVVKEKLEAKIGHPLNQVAIAAAGRALKTMRVKVNTDIPDYREIHRDDILRLELQAVQEAQAKLAEAGQTEEESLNYHCVGYSVVNYELDGYRIGNLYGQTGKNMGVEVIATFLPRVIIDSLFAVLQRVDLEINSLTLEPIAASTVVVPPSMRQLNLVLIDIGAGTSDIALTQDGSIVGYGMVPLAGDEITEKISEHFLVDFHQAEIIKRSFSNHDKIKFSDVLGTEHTVTKQEVIDAIAGLVEFITKQISEKIIELNGRSPQAVICIGGGSLTPLLKDMLAENLGLSKQRVAIRGREVISAVFGAQELAGPEAVTPIGIAVTSFEHKGLGFARVIVNNRQVRLFEVNRGTVADALLAAGINMRKTQPRLGMALTVTVNGELKIIKGGRGKPALIKLNGQEVTIDTPVKHNDVLEFVEAQNGEDARGYIYEVVQEILPIKVTVNEDAFTISPVITMNGQAVTYYDELVDNARIIHYLPKTAAEILEIAGYGETENEFFVYVNDHLVDPMTEFNEGDKIVVEQTGVITYPGAESSPEITVIPAEGGSKDRGEPAGEHFGRSVPEAAAPSAAMTATTTVTKTATATAEGSVTAAAAGAVTEAAAATATSAAKVKGGAITVVYVNQERVEVPRKDIILTDILTRTNFSLTPPQFGMKLDLKVNGMAAEFTTPLKNGDNVSLEWQ